MGDTTHPHGVLTTCLYQGAAIFFHAFCFVNACRALVSAWKPCITLTGSITKML